MDSGQVQQFFFKDKVLVGKQLTEHQYQIWNNHRFT